MKLTQEEKERRAKERALKHWIECEERRKELRKELTQAAWNNRHNPTGKDYLASAKRLKAQGH